MKNKAKSRSVVITGFSQTFHMEVFIIALDYLNSLNTMR